MNVGKIIDAHTHIWLRSDGMKRDEGLLLKAVEQYEITRLYVSPLEGYTPKPEVVDLLNEYTYKFHKAHPDCISSYTYVSPEYDNAVEVVKRGIEDQEAIGVKIWVSAYVDQPCTYRVVEKAIDYGVPLLLHSFHKATGQVAKENTGENIARLAKRYPEAKILMAHLGGNAYHGIPAIRDCPNVWSDWSGSIFKGDELRYAYEYLGADRLVMGSDMPGAFLPSLGQILELNLPKEEQDKMLFGNAEKLIDRNFRL